MNMSSPHHPPPFLLLRLVLVLVLVPVLATHAEPPPAPTPPPTQTNATPPAASSPLSAAAAEFLDAHNKARAEVGVGPLKWSPYLATSANRLVRYQRDKMSCKFANLTESRYGGNQLLVSAAVTVPPRLVVEAWVSEKSYYNHANNSCVPGHMCGVYTQVVWRKSLEVGCGQARCVQEGAGLAICLYNPPGNVAGESPY